MTFRRSLLLSFLIGAFALSTPWTIRPVRVYPELYIDLAWLLPIPWAVLAGVSIWRFGKRGLWLLTSLPLVACLPALFLWIEWSS